MFQKITTVLTVAFLSNLASADEWKLVWSDEFKGSGHPDPEKWGYESGFVRNNEKQFYTTKRLKNARVENGHLVIEGHKESPAPESLKNEPKKPAKKINFTSASLHTKGLASWQFGKIEVRAKVPRGPGNWPAIWTLGNNISTVGWPRCGEIDILEFVGKDPKHIHGNAHFSKNGKHTSDHKAQPQSEPWKDFHTYSIEWDSDVIHFAFDDRRFHSFRIEKAITPEGNPFHKPHYLIINLALGGNWGGPIDDAIFPSRYLIDYVRVYQKNP